MARDLGSAADMFVGPTRPRQHGGHVVGLDPRGGPAPWPRGGARDVVVDSQGRAIVAGASKQGGVLRGHAFARVIGTNEPAPLWAHWFPFSKEASEALGAARDQYNRIFTSPLVAHRRL